MTTTRTPILSPSVRAIIDAGRALERIIERLAPVQLATLLVLDGVAQRPGITATWLATYVGVERQTLHGVTQRMERDGLLSKETDEGDRRVSHFHLTIAGVERLRECEDKLRFIEVQLNATIKLQLGKVESFYGDDPLSALVPALREFEVP